MKLRLIWGLFDLYRQIRQVPKERIMNLGWKTITGAVLAALGFGVLILASYLGEPSLDMVADGLFGLAVLIGGVGVRHAINKVRPQ